MGKYNVTRSEMWGDGEVMKLSQREKLLFTYLLSSTVGNLAGYFKLPIHQVKADLCRYDKETDDYNPEDLEGFKKEILPSLKRESKLWKYDIENEQIFIPNYLKYNKIGGEKQIASINKSLETLTFCDLHVYFLYAIVRYASKESWKYLDKGMVAETLQRAEEMESDEADYLIRNILNPSISNTNTNQYNSIQYNTRGIR